MTKRIFSALILIPIVVYLVLYADIVYLQIAVLFVSLLAFLEWLNMDNTVFNTTKSIYFVLCSIFIFTALFFSQFSFNILMLIFIIHMISNFSNIHLESVLKRYFYFGGIIYISLYIFIVKLATLENGRLILMMVVVSIWVGDTFAYIVGKKFGRMKLAKVISPHKSYEGAFAGIVFGALSSMIFSFFFINGLSLTLSLAIGFIANFVGVFGDLSESVVKRAYNKKDSSSIIPGHGGILDRLDSISFAVFFIYVLLQWKILLY